MIQFLLSIDNRLSETLFAFDDIWREEHFNHLTFAKKSIYTSRSKFTRTDRRFFYIPTAVRYIAIFLFKINQQPI